MYRDSTPGNATSSSITGPWSVRAEFTISPPDGGSSPTTTRSASIVPHTESTGVRMTYSFTPTTAVQPPITGYSFQRGNMTFTSTPPARSHTIPRSNARPSDSGYASEEQRCRSTYNIVLSSARRQLHQPFPRPWSSYYQQHCCRYGAVPEVCEDCAAEAAAAAATTYTSHFCTRLAQPARGEPKSRDAASQTTDIEARPAPPPPAARRKVRRRPTTGAALAGSSFRDELKSSNFGRLSRTSASPRSPTPPAEPKQQVEPTVVSDSASTTTTNAKDDNSSDKRKRTVHIDVYCTGTDDDPNDEEDEHNSSSSGTPEEEEEDSLTQETVFEGTDVRITHSQPKPGVLPRGFEDERAFLKRRSERLAPMRLPSLASSKGYESDDFLSSLYPSQFSSYSRLRDFEWTSAASSSVGLEYDSASATSWKDTVSDMESLINSKTSITPCDSFDTADSPRSRSAKSWRSPQIERKHLLQGKLMKDYMERHPPVGWSSESSAAGSESEEEVGWSFVSSEENTSVVTGKLTLPRLTSVVEKPAPTPPPPPPVTTQPVSSSTDQETSELIRQVRTTVLRDRIGPFGSTTPSPTPSKLQSRVTSPFTTPQGERTDHILKASIFGRVVSTFRKPGHHVGPAKNPSCSCEHCRRYFEENSRRRSRSSDGSSTATSLTA